MTVDDHLREVHEAEAHVAHVEQSRDELREQARRGLAIGGDDATASLRSTFTAHGVSWYPLVAIALLAVVDTFQRYGFSVLAPDISRTLGVPRGAVAASLAMLTVATAIGPLPFAALAQHKARRAMLIVASGFVWSMFTVATGYVTLVGGLFVVLFANGLCTGSVHALHRPFLFDVYPPEARVRVISTYQAGDATGNVIAPLLVAALSAWAAMTWRGVFVTMGLISALACLFAIRLRDPGFGRWDEQMIRDTVRRHEGRDAPSPTDDSHDVALGFWEITRRLMLVPTIRRLLVGYGVFGVLLVPYQTFLFFYLEERWNMDAAARGLFFAFTALVSIIALAAFGRRAEAMFQRDPASTVRLGGLFLAAAVVLICLGGVAPNFAIMVILFSAAQAFLALLRPSTFPALLGVVPAYMRPHAAALTGIFMGGIGGLFGAFFLSGIDSRFGVAAAMGSLVVPGVLGALLISSASRFVVGDLDRMIDEVLEDEEIRSITASGGHLPMLACRQVDFSYGQLQVLFGVDFTVDDGEMVALLGVNGAGKSTLLKVISGIGLPSAGSVRFRGGDITYLDAERRLHLGITQIPGGRAVFGPMTVVENLRGFAYSLGGDTKRIEAGIERSFEAFPRLAERRNQRAATLSGGEQQMLGLSKALILQPRLLLIDELSLGLAPVIVGQLLDMVRQINHEGTAVVLVEQSVNVALNLVDHAYFMEKGEIRFDGPASELLARDDLLRAVFLEGAATQD